MCLTYITYLAYLLFPAGRDCERRTLPGHHARGMRHLSEGQPDGKTDRRHQPPNNQTISIWIHGNKQYPFSPHRTPGLGGVPPPPPLLLCDLTNPRLRSSLRLLNSLYICTESMYWCVRAPTRHYRRPAGEGLLLLSRSTRLFVAKRFGDLSSPVCRRASPFFSHRVVLDGAQHRWRPPLEETRIFARFSFFTFCGAADLSLYRF